MEQKKKFLPYMAIDIFAMVCFLVCLCYNALQLGEIFREYNYQIEFSDIINVFFKNFNDHFIFLLLAIGVLLYKKTCKALPIVFMAYIGYVLLIHLGRFIILDDAKDSDILGIACLLCALIACILWIVKPNSFKSLSLLFLPYVIYIPFALYVRYNQIFSSEIDWFTITYNIGEMALFISLIVKCNSSKDETNWQLSAKTYYYWITGLVMIIAESIAYLIIMTA